MALEISVRNSRLIKRPLSVNEIIGNSNWSYGTFDEHFRLVEGEADHGVFVVYDKDCIGRGVQFLDSKSSREIGLCLLLPATEGDVRMIYEMAERIARLWKSDHILVEGDRLELSEIPTSVEFQKKSMKAILRATGEANSGSSSVQLCCATLPIWLSPDQFSDFAEDPAKFSEFLHDRQKTGAYLATALLLELKGAVSSAYVVFDNAPIILPYEPCLQFVQDGLKYQCSKSYVIVSDLFTDEKYSRIEFSDFLERIPEGKKSEFDAKHFLLNPLTIDELKNIFRPSER